MALPGYFVESGEHLATVQCALRIFAAPVVLTTGLLLWSGSVSLAQDVIQQDVVKQDAIKSEKPAQDTAPAHTLLNPDAQADQEPPYTPITLKQKYIYSIEQMFSGPRLIAILAHAGMDQAEVTPHAWGSNAPAFGVRAASLFGRSFVGATISSGIRGLDHEDPRYFYSHKTNPVARTKYAIVHTFEVRNDNGSMMPAYSRFIGTFGMPFLAQSWRPGGLNAPEALRSAGIGIGMGMAMNVAQEFWPDVKHALHLGPGAAALVSPGTIH
jgi:hypothetical protein